MFKEQIAEAKVSINHCLEVQRYYWNQAIETLGVSGVPFEKRRELTQLIKEEHRDSFNKWLERESIYREAEQVLESLQAEYKRLFPWYKSWLSRDGHDTKLGLYLKSRARLEKLDERARGSNEVDAPGMNPLWG